MELRARKSNLYCYLVENSTHLVTRTIYLFILKVFQKLRWRKFDAMDHPGLFRLVMNCWPPFVGAAIVVEYISVDWRTIRVGMKLRWYNRNYVKSHYGGNLYSMTDPFYMLMLLRNLGRDYIVWDTAARVKFLKPGRSKVTAHFTLEEEQVEEIRQRAAAVEKLLMNFKVNIFDAQGRKVAVITKTLYIRKKTRRIDHLGGNI